MYFRLLDYLCCSSPSPLVTFQYTKVEFTSTHAYFDLFCYMERTVILDQDYLNVTHNFGKSFIKIPIMRDIGNLSGVARVTFPNEQGLYTVNYIRTEKNREIILGQITIPLAGTKDHQSTFDTETYSPKFLTSFKTQFTLYNPSLPSTWQKQVSQNLNSKNLNRNPNTKTS